MAGDRDPDRREALARNRQLWGLVNAEHTDAGAEERWLADEATWGLFRTPDATLNVLGAVADLDVVELGCGTGQLSAWLRRAGARPIGVDVSLEQLRSASRCQDRHGPRFPLLLADAEHLPLAPTICDLVLSEHGAGVWCDPERWVPEAARVLRPGGRLVFLVNSLLSALCVPTEGGVAGTELLRGQRGLSPVSWPGGGVEHHLSHGEWVSVLVRNGFVVEALHELYAPDGAVDDPEYYDVVSREWARSWPAEELWVARRV